MIFLQSGILRFTQSLVAVEFSAFLVSKSESGKITGKGRGAFVSGGDATLLFGDGFGNGIYLVSDGLTWIKHRLCTLQLSFSALSGDYRHVWLDTPFVPPLERCTCSYNEDQSARKRGNEATARCQRSGVDRYIGSGLQRYHEASVDCLSVYSSMVWMPTIIDPPMVQLTLLIDS
ncbi:hypothetical protein EDD85DRAFT_130866 [Armillaria nabsnona]|nr:hypothetical protein EDD85DRAFT_130866 [Armillaria nabsnona]